MKAPINHDIAVLGTGSYLPERVVTNEILEDWCTNFDAERAGHFPTWVGRVTHIQERRYISDGETTAHMGAIAAKRALEMAGVRADQLDLILLATFSPSSCVPGDHALLADMLGATSTPNITVTGACAGSIYAIGFAYGMIASGVARRVLVVGAEAISPTLDYSDPLTAILFGDGAGAAVIGAVGRGGEGGMLAPNLGHEFNWENINMPNANMPYYGNGLRPGRNGEPATVQKTYLKMTGGPSVLRNAVNTMAECVYKCLGYPDGKPPRGDELSELKGRMRVVPHQANGRIVDGLTKKLGVDPMRTTKTVYKVGNVSAGSNMIALDHAMRHGNYTAEFDPESGAIKSVEPVRNPIEKGDVVLLPSIGAGYLFGCVGFVR